MVHQRGRTIRIDLAWDLIAPVSHSRGRNRPRAPFRSYPKQLEMPRHCLVGFTTSKTCLQK
jgi:hypothetical protein